VKFDMMQDIYGVKLLKMYVNTVSLFLGCLLSLPW